MWLLSFDATKQFSMIYFLLLGLKDLKTAVFGLFTPISAI
jgi:hypothetical protein